MKTAASNRQSAAPRKGDSAFTLIECAIAVGLTAFALVGLLSLLPLGMTTFRNAIDISVGSQIFQRVVTDAEQTDFDALLKQADAASEFYVLPTRYFDDQGNEVTVAKPDAPTALEKMRIIYHVRVRGSRPGPARISEHGITHFSSLPALPGKVRFNPRDSTFLTVQIVNNPGGTALPCDGAELWSEADARRRNLSFSTYSMVITRNAYPKL